MTHPLLELAEAFDGLGRYFGEDTVEIQLHHTVNHQDIVELLRAAHAVIPDNPYRSFDERMMSWECNWCSCTKREGHTPRCEYARYLAAVAKLEGK